MYIYIFLFIYLFLYFFVQFPVFFDKKHGETLKDEESVYQFPTYHFRCLEIEQPMIKFPLN